MAYVRLCYKGKLFCMFQDLLKKANQCMELIVTAKDRQAQEANKNADNLLHEIESENRREENRKLQAIKRRERKKKKKKMKQEEERAKKVKDGGSNTNKSTTNQEEDDEDEDEEDEDEEEEKTAPKPTLKAGPQNKQKPSKDKNSEAKTSRSALSNADLSHATSGMFNFTAGTYIIMSHFFIFYITPSII